MKILLLVLVNLIIYPIFGNDDINYKIVYSTIDQIPQGENEILYHRDRGFYRYFIFEDELFDAFVITNQKEEAEEVVMIRENKTNRFVVFGDVLKTPTKNIKMGMLKLIAFPEVQLKSFIQDKSLKEIEYYAIRMDLVTPHRFVAKKLPEQEDGLIPVQITFKWLIPSIVKFIYYYSPDTGIAVKKEGYFFSKTPTYIMELIKNN